MGINTPDIELLSDETRQSEQRYANSDFNKLGQQDFQHSRDTLQNILIVSPSTETDELFNAQLGYRHQYTLQSLLGIVGSEEQSKKFEGDPIQREIKAMEILTFTYPKLLEYRPNDALLVAKGLCTKLENQKEFPLVDYSHKRDKESEQKRDRTYAILKFFEIASDFANFQSEEITINTFKTLLESVRKTDFMSFSKVNDILASYFDTTAKKRNYPVFEDLAQTLFTTMAPLHPSEEENEISFNSATQLYKHIYNISEELPITMQLDIRKQIIDRALAVASNSLNFERIRGHYLWVLSNVISKNRGWAHDPRVLKQEISFHVKTLEIAKSLLVEKTSGKNELQKTSFDLLKNLLEQYANGVFREEDTWVAISKKHDPKFKEGLKLYLENLTIKDDAFESLEEILNVKNLRNPNHPFHKEGIIFYDKYFSEEAKKLEQ